MPNDPNPNPTGPQGDPKPSDQDPAKGDPGKGPEGDPTPQGGDQADALAAAESAREAAEKRAADAEAEANRLRRSNAATKGTDLDALKSEIRQEFAAELVRAKVEAAAAGKFRDTADALALVDLSALAGADGSVNAAAVTAALDKLIQEKPYLSASAEPGRWGDVGAGPRESADTEPASPYERLRRVQRNS
ncbi:hypothetical protein OG401_23495 [Kitasatospora purpeofusca]|uniref:hypothetical protein n=1 Tax=Kitasatospora purpeofusca TaxID=67352 RepID=UPI00224D6E54|nr:hypothetical protein [Kitasatospora purpeofusca]MCX4687233.1 hypothetical protein [Kitasatospora purpeofusca]